MLQIKADKLKNGVILVALFLSTMNFGAKFFYFAFAALILLSLFQRKLNIHFSTLPYLLLGVLMAIYNSDEGILSMIRCFSYVSLYIVGYNLVTFRMMKQERRVNINENHSESIPTKVIFTVALGSFAHYLINFISNMGNNIGRNTIDIWSGNITAATGQAALASIMLGLAVSLIILPKKKIYRYIGVINIVLILAYNLILAGRTLITMLFILFIIGMVYFRIVTPKALDRYKLIFALLLILMITFILFLFNVGGIQNLVFNSNLLERFDAISLDTSRNDTKMIFLTNIWKYPFGGLNLRVRYGHAHDLLLDGYDEYGFLGFLLLLLILILGIRTLWLLLRRTDYSNEFKMMALCVYSAILMVFTLEPILDGMPWLLICFCLLNGVLDGMRVTYRNRRSDE